MIAEKYREIAAGCEKRAAETADPTVRNYFLSLARSWRKLADRAEREEL